MPDITTPGVFIEETNSFPHSIAAVATAVPAFIGYTPRTEHEGKSYLFKPMRISSLNDFLKIYVGEAAPYQPDYYLVEQKTAPEKGEFHEIADGIYTLEPDPNTVYYLYNSLHLFFQNGGGEAYIVSIGDYGKASGSPKAAGELTINPNVSLAEMKQGLAAVEKEEEITLYVFPEATLLSVLDNRSLMEAALLQCGESGRSMSLLDVIGGDAPDLLLWEEDIQQFRNNTGDKHLKYGAAYYPFVKSTVVAAENLSYTMLNGGEACELESSLNPSGKHPAVGELLGDIHAGNKADEAANHKELWLSSPTYREVLSLLATKINVLPPSGMMAGIYTYTDSVEGVWKAPANVSLSSVVGLTINIDNNQQENLNIDPLSGKSINALRSFAGRGILVWGARTLAGNSNDWRYISVRRTMIMIEQSIKGAMRSFVFEPNDANTWIAIKGMVANFLNNLWIAGGLVGAKPEDAFYVQIGLGETMTDADIMNGKLIVSIGVAISRPAEFIVVRIEQDQVQS